MSLDIDVTALTGLETYLAAFPEATREAARIALNDVTEREGLATFRKEIAAQVDFAPGYLNDDRLGITDRARNDDLKVVVTGRSRATSLARFARGQTPESTRGRGVRVQVKTGGGGSRIESGFLIRLASNNIGLALRLQPGEKVVGKTKQVQLDTNLYLLYGPSVDQIFRDVAVDEAPMLLQEIGNEFFRQFFRLTRDA